VTLCHLGAFDQELRRLTDWGEQHRRLCAHLVLLVGATLVVDAVGTTLVYFLEHNADGSEVHSVFQAFFFTTVQLLTVSSQLKNPVTTGGRVLDVFLECWAVLVVAGSAGAIASFLSKT
jgi:hypothetical protein